MSESMAEHKDEPRLVAASTHEDLIIPRGSVTAQLNFFTPPSDGSIPFNLADREGQPQNYGAELHDVTIQDARGRETEFTLDSHSFAFLSGVESAEKHFINDDSIKRLYYPEIEKLLIDNVPGATRVLIFDHTIRRADHNAERTPLTRTHIDQTPLSAEMRVRYHISDASKADKLLGGVAAVSSTCGVRSTGPSLASR